MNSDLSTTTTEFDPQGTWALRVLGTLSLVVASAFGLGVLWAAQSMLLRTGEPYYDAQWAGDIFIKSVFVPGVLAFGVGGLACWLCTPPFPHAGPRSAPFRVLALAHVLPILLVIGAVAWKLLAGPHREAARREPELLWMVGDWLLLACVPLLIAALAFVRGRWSVRTMLRVAGLGSLAWVWATPVLLAIRSGAVDVLAVLAFYAPLTFVAVVLVALSYTGTRATPIAAS
jgi:hypothetical protein